MEIGTHEYGQDSEGAINLLFAENPLIDEIAKAIREEFGVDTRPGAQAALAEWESKTDGRLTGRDRGAVLSRFPASQIVDLSFDEGGWLEEHLNEQHERLCALNGESGEYSQDIAFIEAIIAKLA